MNRKNRVLLAASGSLAVAAVIGGALTVQGGSAAGRVDDRIGGAPWSESYQYNGAVQYVNVPPDTDQMTIVATGGDGGAIGESGDAGAQGSGAVVTGTISVAPGQKVAISVGGMGQAGGTTSSDPHGGWGGLGLNGGNGNGAKDHLRTSGAGGGATTVQLANADGSDQQTIVIASGGGGDGAPSGDPAAIGQGGNGGQAWGGQNGEDGSDPLGGSAGKAATVTTGIGARGVGGSGLGGNGGGGGGGVAGGGGGGGAKGTSAGGGGGSGSSVVTGMSNTSIAARYSWSTQQGSSNGVVTITWLDV